MENIQRSSKRPNRRNLCCSSPEPFSQCKKNESASENTAYSSRNEDSRAGQGVEEKCVSPPRGVNLSSLLDPWKQIKEAFSPSGKRAERETIFIPNGSRGGGCLLRRYRADWEAYFAKITLCLCGIRVYEAPGAVCLGEVSADSKTQLIILR